ncbi:hypothetical protein BG011_006148 [Mortierella polycephala]|uniref:ARM repeat-containing protein n=1 Tax=Mortierella polycephala TaxID=41804 RepID=A0A9P6U0D4_9FUNG|nr:hypothetical protein BG011_006148 [Mortierella polycephala]
MITTSNNQHSQGFRFYKPSQPLAPAFIYIIPLKDTATGKDVILWEDIQVVFGDVQCVGNGESEAAFLRDSESNRFNPWRIEYQPDTILDVFMEGSEDKSRAFPLTTSASTCLYSPSYVKQKSPITPLTASPETPLDNDFGFNIVEKPLEGTMDIPTETLLDNPVVKTHNMLDTTFGSLTCDAAILTASSDTSLLQMKATTLSGTIRDIQDDTTQTALDDGEGTVTSYEPISLESMVERSILKPGSAKCIPDDGDLDERIRPLWEKIRHIDTVVGIFCQIFNGETSQAPRTSSNDLELQKAEAIAFAETIQSNRHLYMFGIATVADDEVRRVLKWAESMDVEVHKAAAVSLEVMAEDRENRVAVARSWALDPLMRSAHSEDLRVQRNATATLFNLTISHDSRQALIDSGAVLVLFKVLTSNDKAVLRNCTAALANIPISKLNLEQLEDVGIDAFSTLIHLLNADDDICCQAARILTNVADDKKSKEDIVKSKGLPALLLMSNSKSEFKVRDALRCVSKLAELQVNASAITRAGFNDQLLELLDPDLDHEIPTIAITIIHRMVHDVHLPSFLNVPSMQQLLKAGLLRKLCHFAIVCMNREQQDKTEEALVGCSDMIADMACNVHYLEEQLLYGWDDPEGSLREYFVRTIHSSVQCRTIATACKLLEGRDNGLKALIKQLPEVMSKVEPLLKTTQLDPPPSAPSFYAL